jgi:hypothetical protein
MARKSAKPEKVEEPMKLFYIFYNQERWDNWISRLGEASFEGPAGSEDIPEGFRLLDIFGKDITISVLKIIRLYQNKRFTKEEALDKIARVEAIVLENPPAGPLEEIIGSFQLSLLVLFAASKKFLEGSFETDIKVLIKDGRVAVADDSEKALDIAAQVGANVINGTTCCGKYVKDDIEDPTLFDEWLIECETMSEAVASLKDFDEVTGEDS